MKTVSLLLTLAVIAPAAHAQIGNFFKKILTEPETTSETTQSVAATENTVIASNPLPSDALEVTVEAIAAEYQSNPVLAAKNWEIQQHMLGGAVFNKPSKAVKITATISGFDVDTTKAYNRYDPKRAPLDAGGKIITLTQPAQNPTYTRPTYFVTAYVGSDDNKWSEQFKVGDEVVLYGSFLKGGTRSIVVLPTHILAKAAPAPAVAAPNLDIELKLQQKVTRREVKRAPLAERAGLNDALLQAAQSNDWDTVIEALQAGANPNMLQPSSQTNALALFSRQADKLSAKERFDYTKKLLEYGVDASGGLYNWPLLTAVQRKEDDLVLLLLQNGANPNDKVMFGREQPLVIAKRNGQTKVVQLLEKAAR
jgi:hypothetical protein